MYKSAGPYGEAKVRRSVVLYADILGFTEMMRACHDSTQEHALLDRLLRALNAAHDEFKGSNILTQLPTPFAVKAFTDNIVLGYPIADDAEAELGHVLMMIASYQMRLIEHGFFIRGAIDIDGLYMDDRVVFGKGLLNAYHAEQKTARYPRIMLTQAAASTVRNQLRAYASAAEAPHNSVLTVEKHSGQMFVHYLRSECVREDGYIHENVLQTHKERVESQLQATASDGDVFQKFGMIAKYHDYFCNEVQREALRVNPQLMAPAYFASLADSMDQSDK